VNALFLAFLLKFEKHDVQLAPSYVVEVFLLHLFKVNLNFLFGWGLFVVFLASPPVLLGGGRLFRRSLDIISDDAAGIMFDELAAFSLLS